MYMTPIYTGMKCIWLLDGMKIFPILNTVWTYVIVHKFKPPHMFFYRLFIQTQLHNDKCHEFWFNPIIRPWVMLGAYNNIYRQDQKQYAAANSDVRVIITLEKMWSFDPVHYSVEPVLWG